jgi:class 3 adenylate cyclase
LLAPGDERGLTLPLEAGRYRLRTLGLAGGQFLVAGPEGAEEITLTAARDGWPRDEVGVSLAPTLHFQNATDAEQLFVLERMAWSDQASTAAEVTALQVFRNLFSSELLRPGERISVGSLTVLFTDLRDSTSFYQEIGDAPAFGRVMDHFAVVQEAIAEEDGALVKTIGDAVMAVFRRPASALRAILDAQRRLAAPSGGATSFYHDRLDYFGSVVNMAARLERLSSGEDVIVSEAVRRDPEVEELLSAPDNRLITEPFVAQLKGFDEAQFHLWRVLRSSGG